MDWTALIIQLVCGAIGGNVAGAALKDQSLGTAGNSIAGIIGGAIGGQGLANALGMAAGGQLDVASIVSSVAGGGIGGAILMVIIGIIRKQTAK